MFDQINKQINITKTHTGKILFGIVLVCAFAMSSLFVGSAQNAQATIPKIINFQGKLTAVSNGTNVANGTYAFEFKIYDALTSGTLLWTETYDQPSGACGKLTVTNGVFNAKLGSCNALTSVDFTGGSLYMTVNFAPTGTSYDGEMSPRKQLVSSAFAFVANGVSGDGKVNATPGQSTTALTVARSGSDYAFQVDTNTASSATGLKVTSAAAAGGLALNVISSGTNENLTLDAKGSGTISVGATSTGNILLGGGSGSTGCTVTNSTGAFVCTASVTAPYIYGGDMTTTYAGYQGGVFGGSSTHGVLDFVDNGTRIGEFYTTSSAFNFFSDTGKEINFYVNNDFSAAAIGIPTSGNIVLAGGSGTTGCTVTNSNGNFACTGALSGSNLSGTNTGDQTITLTGDVTGSGTGSFATTIGADKVLESNLKAVNGASDEYCLTYESTAGDFEWQTCGSALTPWTSNVDADGYALQDALNLEFRTAAGSAPAGTVVALFQDNSGDLTANVLTAKTFNIAVNGTDEYNFSSTGLALNSNDITGGGTITGTTINGTSAIQLNGTDINTAGTLTNVAYENQANVFTLNQTIQKADPSIVLDVTTATDTDFWLGVQDDAGSDDDDVFQIGDGTTVGSNPFFTINTSGNVGIGVTNPAFGKLQVASTTASLPSIRAVTTATSGSTAGGEFVSNGNGGTANYGVYTYADGTTTQNTGILAYATGATTNVGGQIYATGAHTTNVGLNVTSTGATNNTILLMGTNTPPSGNYGIYNSSANNNYFAGNVGVGDVSPNSLFTVGSGDLFQINSSGQIGSQQAPVSDYLFALAGTTGNDHSRIIDITQANNANEDSRVISIVNTASPASAQTSGVREIYNTYSSLTPVATVNGTAGNPEMYLYGSNQVVSTSTISLGDTSVGNVALNTYGDSSVVNFNPTLNDTDGSGGLLLNAYGTKSTVQGTQAYTSVAGYATINTYAGSFSNNYASGGNANTAVTSYGVYAEASGNLTATGTTQHIGGYFNVDGTATTNYGIYANVSGATTNYAAILNGGNVGIGTSSPTSLLSVGSSSQFQVNSSGAIAAATGVTSSGTITFSGLGGGGTKCVQTDNAGVISAAAAACGTGAATAWDAIADPSGNGAIAMGTTVQTLDWGATTTTDNLTVTSSGTGLTSGSAFKVTSATTGAVTNGIVQLIASAAYTGAGGLLNVTANSTATGNVASFSGTALTSGTGLLITGGTSLTTNGELVDLNMGAATAGNGINIRTTGVYTGTGLSVITANSATTGTISAISATGLTTGFAQSATLGTALTTGGLLSSTGASYLHTGTETGSLLSLAYTDASSNAAGTATTNGILLSPTIATTASSGAKNINGLYVSPTFTSCGDNCTYNGIYQSSPNVTQSAANSTVLNSIRIAGNSTSLTQNTLGGSLSWYGVNLNTPNLTQTTGVVTATGIYLGTGTITTNGTQQAININSQGVGAGSLTGIAINNINSPGAGTEKAITIGYGWDNGISFTGTTGTTTQSIIDASGYSYLHTGSETGNLVTLAYTDASSNAAGSAVTTGINLAPTIATTASAGSKTINGINIAPTYTSCGTTAGTCVYNGIQQTTAAVTQTTTNNLTINANNISAAGALVQNTAAGTISWVGQNIQMPNITQTTGTVTSTGIKITGGTVTSGTSYALTTTTSAGNVGIGTATPTALFSVGSSSQFQVNSSGAIAAVVGITSSSNYVQSAGTFSLTSANTTQTTTSSVAAINANSLTSGTGLYLASSTLTSGAMIDVAVTGTAALTNQKGINVSLSGANGSGSQTTYGGYFSNTHTGSGINVGLYSTASGGSSSYAAIFANGNVGVNTTAPVINLHVVTGGVSTGLGSTPADRGIAITGNGGQSRIYMEAVNATSGQRVFSVDNTAGVLSFNSLNDAGSSFVTQNILNILYSGSVGVGTSGPDRKLDVLDASNPQLRLTTTDGSVYSDLQNSANINLAISGSSLAASSGLQYGLQVNPTINQSSTAGYTSLLVNPTETATGSGVNSLADFQTGSSSKLAIRNDGSILMNGNGIINTPFGGYGHFENYLVRSEDFTTTWTTSSISAISADGQTAPDGTTTAESLATSGSGGYVQQDTSTAVSSTTYTFSVWARAASGTQSFGMRIDGTTSGTGTEKTFTATTSWQRFYVTQSVAAYTGNVRVRIYPGTSASTGTIYAWGAQLDNASVPSLYAKTTSAALTNLASRGMIVNTNMTNTTASGFLYGERHVNVINSTTAGTHVGQFVRMVDNTTLDSGQTVRGLEVQAYSGTNTNGTNTGIASYGYTFGIQATTTAQAAAQAAPAALFADLDNGTDSTTKARGNAIRAYTNDATSADMVYIYQETSAYTGNALLMDLGNGGGSFASGNFINLKNAGTSKFTVASTGRTDLLAADADNIIPLYINTEESTITQSIFAVESDTTSNGQSADTVKAHIEADGSAFFSLTGTQNTVALCHANNGQSNNDEIVDCSGAPSDVAEYFGSEDSSLSAGDVVVAGKSAEQITLNGYHTSKAWVAKSTSPYQSTLMGVVSTSPAVSYGDEIFKANENPRPVALSGRVPVKVSNENGVIEPGDFLTASSTPGYAMKATKAGPVIGQALESFSGGFGKAMVFVKATTYNGVAIEKQTTGISFDFSSDELVAQTTTAILDDLISKLPSLNSTTLSQISTDVVTANGAVVSPYVTTHMLRTDVLSAVAEQGGIQISSKAVFNGGLQVDSISSISDLLVFEGSVEFLGTPYFTKDTAGFAVVQAGAQVVDIKFEREYLAQPIVNATLSFEQESDLSGLNENEIQDLHDASVASAQNYLLDPVSYVVTNKSKYGFTIVLNKPTTNEIKFSWTALAVKNANIFSSIDTAQPQGYVAGETDGGQNISPNDTGGGNDVIDSGGGSGSVDNPPDNNASPSSDDDNLPTIP